ncbi:hypothetical protein RFI_36243, partial [Reticulomyxa filosa]
HKLLCIIFDSDVEKKQNKVNFQNLFIVLFIFILFIFIITKPFICLGEEIKQKRRYTLNDVFDLNIYHLKDDNIPIKDNEIISDHCLIRISDKEMLFFYYKSCILIKYDEYNNKFYFNHIKISDQLSKSVNYCYVYVDDMILLFGGCIDISIASAKIYKFVIINNEWVDIQNNLYIPLTYCVALFSEDDDHINIIGGLNDKNEEVSNHMKINLSVFNPLHLVKSEMKDIIQHWIKILQIKFGWIDDFDTIIMKYSRLQKKLNT